MVRYIDAYRHRFGVEPICRIVPIAPSTYYAHKARARDPGSGPDRARRDAWLRGEIQRVWQENFRVYGVRKVWRQLQREGIEVARCTVARLMKSLGLRGARRGRVRTTTRAGRGQQRPQDAVQRVFTAPRPNALWVADMTYVATSQGFVYVALVIDAYARRIVGWCVARRLGTELALQALEQALAVRNVGTGPLVHHSDRGVQYVSMRYSERLSQAGITPSVGRVGDSYDNALAETVIGLYKTELIRRQGPWPTLEAVEYATLAWVDWFNHRRLLQTNGDRSPAEKETLYDQQQDHAAKAA